MAADAQILVLASGNAGKLREFNRLLAPLGFDVRPQKEFEVPPCEEPFETFLENALLKARHAAKHSGFPALADDSGICVPVLGGAPGVFSARFSSRVLPSIDMNTVSDAARVHWLNAQQLLEAGEVDAANNAALLASLTDEETRLGVSDRRAFYVAVLAFVTHEKDPCPLVAQGMLQGEVAREAAGNGGFGYDPLMYLADFKRNVAQITDEEKNTISHRAKALQQLKEMLRSA